MNNLKEIYEKLANFTLTYINTMRIYQITERRMNKQTPVVANLLVHVLSMYNPIYNFYTKLSQRYIVMYIVF